MADKKQDTLYLPGSDPETVAANETYRKAEQELQAALDARKNRIFDPTMLALAQAFATPTKTGSFFESLGNVAGTLREQQGLREKEDLDIAEMRRGLAASGLGLLRQKKQQEMLWGEPPATSGPVPQQGALPSAQEAPQGGLPTANKQPAPAANFLGIDLSPGEARLVSSMLFDNKPADQILKTILANRQTQVETEAKKIIPLQDGSFINTTTGERTFPVGEETIDLYGSTYKVPKAVAIQFQNLIAKGDTAGAKKYIENYFADMQSAFGGKPSSPGVQPSAPSATAIPSGKPAEPAVSRPTQIPSQVPARPLSIQEQEALKKEQTLRAESGSKLEEPMYAGATAARELDELLLRSETILNKHPDIVGLLSKTGPVGAGLKFLGGSLGKSGHDIEQITAPLLLRDPAKYEARQALDNLLQEIAALRTKMLQAHQGSTSNLERQMDTAISGSVSQPLSVLRARIALDRARVQFVLQKKTAYEDWKDQNPSKTLKDFESSPVYRGMLSRYNENLEEVANAFPEFKSVKNQTQSKQTGKKPSKLSTEDYELLQGMHQDAQRAAGKGGK